MAGNWDQSMRCQISHSLLLLVLLTVPSTQKLVGTCRNCTHTILESASAVPWPLCLSLPKLHPESLAQSLSRMQRAIDGWPRHWYNHEGCIPYPAQGCTKMFNNSNIEHRGYHYWWHQETSSPSCNDHSVLLAIHRQKKCVYCDYHNDQRALSSRADSARIEQNVNHARLPVFDEARSRYRCGARV